MLKSLKNQIGFKIREQLPDWRKKPYQEFLEEEIEQFYLPPDIAHGYRAASLRSTLFYAWLLDQIPLHPERQTGRVLDIGSKNFYYASALYFWSRQSLGEHELTGLEIDPYRTYINFYKRGDYARYYVSLLRAPQISARNVFYRQGDWLKWNFQERYDLITSFFPFITPRLHEDWGIPRQSFDPETYYRKIFSQTRDALFFHQGDLEMEISLRLMEEIGGGEVLFYDRFLKNPWEKRTQPVWILYWRSASLDKAELCRML